MLRSGWSFRLRAELQQRCIKDNWYCGFVTLTYNDDCLPTIPQKCFLGYDPQKQILENGCLLADSFGEELHTENYQRVPCFSKDDIRAFIKGIKRYLRNNFGFKDLIYFLAGEYGSNTRRPHYHALFAFPRIIPPSVFYGLVRDYWTGENNVVSDKSQIQFNHVVKRPNRGFVCPRELDGYAEAGEKPFIVADPLAAANYCSKYACKDLYYQYDIKDIKLDKGCKCLKEYMCFHVQSRSLGVHILDKLTDEEKMTLYKDGFGFIGEDRLSPIPIYIKNKLLFTPYYIVDNNGKRLVRRQCTDFLKNHLKEIFDKKLDYYEKIFEDARKSDYFQKRFVSSALASRLANYNATISAGYTPRRLAEHYLTYFGQHYANCVNDAPQNVWASRFSEFGDFINPNAPLVNPFFIGALNDIVSAVLGSLSFCITAKYTPETELADMVKDFFSHYNKRF